MAYSWTLKGKPDGSATTLKNSTSAQASFDGDKLGEYTVELVVNDGTTSSEVATTVVTLTNAAPVANAGADQKVDVGTTVTLDASGSTDADGHSLSYAWSLTVKPTASAAALSAANAAKPTFVVDLPGEYTFSLVVNDGYANSAADTVTISTNNVPPVANAGSNIGGKFVGDTIMLDGSKSSDLDGDPITYAWTLNVPAGSKATLSSATTVMPTFVIDVKGLYEATLIVSDGKAQSAPATVQITADGNTPPVADAGPDQNATVGTLVTLNGKISDIDGDTLTLSWSITEKPTGSNAALSSTNTATTSFTPDVAGDYIAQLTVSDGQAQVSDTVTISTVALPPPIADAGPDQSFKNVATVVLDGSKSSGADALTYAWSFISRPAGSAATLTGANTAQPSFTLDVEGTYVVQLIVSAGARTSAPDSVTTSYKANVRPVAEIEAEVEWIEGQVITLDGLGSSDADGDVLTSQWSVIQKPEAATASFDNDSDPQPNLTVSLPGEYRVQLIVNDGLLDSEPKTLVLTVIEIDPTKDTDGDGLPDVLELKLDLDPTKADTGNTGTPDGLKDFDNDGLTNIWEYRMGYDLTKTDSDGNGVTDANEDFDGDGISNRLEIEWGTDPMDPNTAPFSFVVSQSPVVPGGRINYVIHVSNMRKVDSLESVVVQLTVPAGVSFHRINDAEPTVFCAATNCAAGHEARWTLGNLAVGESRTIEVNATVAASVVPGTLIQTPVIITATGLGDTIHLTRTAQVVATQPVFFTLNPSKDPVAPGETFTYELDLGNSSSTALTGSEIRLQLPAGLTVNSISNSGTQSGNTVRWNVDSLAAGSAVKRSVSVTLANDALLASTLTAVAQLRHDGGLEMDRELHASVSVAPTLPLAVSYTLLDSPVAAGGQLRYVLTISNTDSVRILDSVTATLRVPPGVSFHRINNAEPTASCPATTCTAGLEATWALGNLAVGESRTIEVNATVAASVVPGTLIQTPVIITATGLGDTIHQVRTTAVRVP